MKAYRMRPREFARWRLGLLAMPERESVSAGTLAKALNIPIYKAAPLLSTYLSNRLAVRDLTHLEPAHYVRVISLDAVRRARTFAELVRDRATITTPQQRAS